MNQTFHNLRYRYFPYRVLASLLLGALLMAGATLSLTGCGGANPSFSTASASSRPESDNAGRATVSVRWPEPSRLIPAAASSLRIEIRDSSGLMVGSQLLARPPQGGIATATFAPLPLGTLTAQATAYPNADGTGVVQAMASTSLAIQAGQTTNFRIAPVSTIGHIEVTPTAPALNIGETTSVTVTAKNTAGDVVLTQASTFAWNSDNETVATISAAGVVSATGAGTANITVTETESGKAATLLVTVTAPPPPPPTGQMYVSSFYTHNIQRYDSGSGAFVGSFIPTQSGGLHLPHEILFGPNNLVYISTDDSGVRRYNADTGAYVDTLIEATSGGLNNACEMTIGKDGSLLVCSAWTNEVKRFDAQTGTFLGNFISGNGLVLPHDILLGPDNRLYVCSNRTNEVKWYDADTGAFLGNFVTAGSGGLSEPSGLVFGPDGNLYVTSFTTHEVKRYNGTTGAYLNNFVSAQSGNLTNPVGLAFGPDGNLYVVSKDKNLVKRYHGQTGTYLGDMDPGNTAALDQPWGIAFY